MNNIKAIPNFPDYLASTDGEIYSVAHRANIGRPKYPMLKKAWLCRGYPMVDLHVAGKSYKKFVHHLVLLTFVGERPLGYQCRHLDGNPLNPKLDNLKWGTRSENQMDRLTHGRDNRGSKHGMNKLSHDNVISIRSMAIKNNKGIRKQDRGGDYKRIAKLFGVSTTTVSAIVSGRTWKWLV